MTPSTRAMPPTSASDIKYSPGAGPRRSGDHPLTRLESVTLAHVAVFAIAATWAFGGNAEAVEVPLAWWGSLGGVITLAAILKAGESTNGSLQPLKWLYPIAAFNALVVAATFNPSLREMTIGGETVLLNTGARGSWPSSARPEVALRRLWLFDAAWISAFNLLLVIRQRRALRGLVLVLIGNALVLSVFGTVQKLSGAPGLYFGAVASPQRHFFSTFIYHNHWGSFMVLMLAACIGLTWYYARRIHVRDILHSPVFGALAVILLMSATVPLSTSRSCTLLVLLLFAAAFGHWITVLIQKRRQFRESIALPIAGALGVVVLVGAGIWFVARDSILIRLEKTREQVADMRARGSIGGRATLYADTWAMAKDKPWFGWGMGSYPHVFTLYNTQKPVDRLPVWYHDAHSDWLQALAEHGVVGSALLAASALVPLASVWRRRRPGTIARYLLGGCALIVLYAWIEFPFGNFAVVLLWWLCFFGAVQYMRLKRPDRSPSAGIRPVPGSATSS